MTLKRPSALRSATRSFLDEQREEGRARRVVLASPLGAASVAQSGLRAATSQYLLDAGFSMGAPGEETTWLDTIPKPVAGALRGLASALEPFQLPQDAFFAVVAGALDPETTIAERLGRMQWGRYAPGGEAPERVADGQELMRLMGFNETVSKWGGIAADLVVDPLVFGSWFRIAGKVSGAADLVNVGNRIDRMMSPLGAATDLNRFARRSDAYRNFQDARMQGLFDALRNPDSTVFGIQRFGERATRALDFVLPDDTMFNLRFGAEMGGEVLKAQRQAALAGRDLSHGALLDMQRVMHGANGDMQRDMVRGVLRAMDDHALAREGVLSRFNSGVVREALDSAIYDVSVQQQGAAFVALGGRVPASLDEGGRLTRLGEELRGALAADFGRGEAHNAEAILTDVLGRRFESATSARRTAVIELAGEEARKAGVSASEVERSQRLVAEAFDEYLAATMTIDARIGLATSGYDFVARNLRQRGLELGASPDEIDAIFQTVLNAGLLKGQKGIEELWDTATSIHIRGPRYHSQKDVMRRVEDIRVRTNAVRGYTGELNSLKGAYRDTVRAPRERYRSDLAASRLQRDEAIGAARAERDASVEGFRQRGRAEHERLAGEAREARRTRDATVEELRADTAAGRAATSDEYLDLLFDGERHLVSRADALAEATIRLSPQRLSPAVTGNPLFADLPATGKKLREARTRYEAFADDIIAAERVTPAMANRFIKAEKEVLDLVSKQEQLLLRFGELLGEAGQTARRGPSATLRGLREQVEAWRNEAQSLRVALEGSQGHKLRSSERIAATAKGHQAENLQAAEAARGAARGVTQEADATRAAVRQSVATGQAEARVHFSAAEEAARAQQQRAAAGARVARDDAVSEAQARVAGVRTSMEDEYAALKRGKPGSSRDRAHVARHAAGRPQPQLIERADPLALDGSNTSLDEILAARLERAEKRLERGTRQDPEASILNLTEEAAEELLKEPVTYGELLQGISQMQALPLGEFLQGLMDGHLRKAYGLFMDGTNFQHYIDRVRRGAIVSGVLLDEMNLRQLMPGLEREAELITSYHNALKAAGGGQVLRKNGIVAHLAENGVTGERTNRALEALARGMHDNPAFHTALDVLKERQARYVSEIGRARQIAADSDTPMVANRRFFAEQVDMPARIAATLGEHAQASLSIFEGARIANRVVARQEFTQKLYTLARDRGFIKSAPFVDPHGARYVRLGEAEGAMGGFAGQYVHPYLVTELQRLSNVEPQFLGAGFQRLRSLITGGFLASPSVLAANFMGGFYQAATAGVNPAVMVRRMAEVLPDMTAAAKGEVTELMGALKRHLDLEMSSLVGSDKVEDFSRLVARNVEMSPEGMGKLADDVGRWYEDFLQRPGLGKFRVPFAGLEGFQFSENWFKVAAFKEMREQLRLHGAPGVNGGPRRTLSAAQIDETAAEFARTVVFDYSSLPRGLEMLKQSGVIMFPGFPYFLASRTLGAALNRPGTLAVADRLTEALANVTLDPLDQVAAYLGMPEYLREEQGVPLPFSLRAGSGGHDQVSMIPFAQLVPTATIWDGLFGKGLGANPWAESITQGGMWGPLLDVLTALVYNDGEATVTARFGHRVHDPGAAGGEKAAQVMRFLWNTMAPSVVRRGLREDYQGQLQGLLPGVGRLLGGLGADMPEELAKVLYSFEERRTGRPEKGWREDVIASFLRSPTVVALEGPLAGIREEMEGARAALNDELGVLMSKYRRAQSEGNAKQAQRLFERMEARRTEFNDTWREYVDFYRANTQRRREAR